MSRRRKGPETDMHVCLDIQSAIAQRAGVGRYTRSLVEHLGADAAHDAVRLFYFDFQRRGAPFPAPGMEQRAVRWCPGRLVQGAWKRLRWPPFDWFAGRADVYHFPNFIVPPLTAGRSVVTIHDVSFLRYPQFAEARNLAYLTARMADTVRRADAIITVSRFCAAEIIALLRAPPAKVFPIHSGLPAELAPPPPEAVARLRARRALQRPYLLTVGTLEPRKNLEFLVAAFEHMTAFDGELVIAGMRGWKYETILRRIAASPRAAAIRLLDYVPDADLPALYGGAEAFLFPSLYEGFGFPPLEAMACGTPVVASTGGALAEVLAGGGQLLAEFDPERWAAVTLAVVNDRALRQTWIDKGRRHAAQYRWQETARQTWRVYRQVMA